jgi:hypothetical protein
MYVPRPYLVLTQVSVDRDKVLSYDSRLYTAARYIQNFLFYFLFGAHAIETPLFAWSRLRKHGVPVLSLTWLKWMLTIPVGGKL